MINDIEKNIENKGVDFLGTEQNSEVTINLFRLFKRLIKNIWFVIMLTIICAGAMFVYTNVFKVKTYSSTTEVFVTNRNEASGGTSSSDVSASLNSVETIAKLLLGSEVMSDVIEELNLGDEYTIKTLPRCITASQVPKTQILKIDVVTTNGIKSAKIASVCAEKLVAYMSELPGTTYNGKVTNDCWIRANGSTEDTFFYSFAGPSTTKNVLIGAVAGFLLACVIVVVMELCSNDIYDDEYILQTYHLPVLAAIPDFSVPVKNVNPYEYKHEGGKK